VAQREKDRAAVGAPRKLLAAAEGLRRAVAGEARIDGTCGARLAVCKVEHEGAAVGSGSFPLVPVANKARAILVETAAARACQRALVLGIAAEVGAFLGDVAPCEQLRGVGGDFEAGHIGPGPGNLCRGGAGFRIDTPDLTGPRGVREEIEDAVLVEGGRT